MRIRIILLICTIGVFIISFFIGSTIPLDTDYAEELEKQFMEKIQGIDEIGIFYNNFLISLGMFIPVIGFFFGLYSGLSTGLVLNAISIVNDIEIVSLSVFLTPFGILELVAYGIAMSRSFLLSYDLIKKKPWKKYLRILVIEALVVCVILIVAAYIEWAMIRSINGI